MRKYEVFVKLLSKKISVVLVVRSVHQGQHIKTSFQHVLNEFEVPLGAIL